VSLLSVSITSQIIKHIDTERSGLRACKGTGCFSTAEREGAVALPKTVRSLTHSRAQSQRPSLLLRLTVWHGGHGDCSLQGLSPDHHSTADLRSQCCAHYTIFFAFRLRLSL
jgi:hypothetical protein